VDGSQPESAKMHGAESENGRQEAAEERWLYFLLRGLQSDSCRRGVFDKELVSL
jgi:hypothetical protein